MKKGKESLISVEKKKKICSICKSDRIIINNCKIKDKNLKVIINNMNNNKDMHILIQKCKCQNAHKLCVLLNFVFNFDLKCNECKAYYNINISNNINIYKKCLKICLLILLSFFHIILYAACVVLLLFLEVINKNVSNNLEQNKINHFFYFFGSIIFIVNTLLIFITYSNFIDNILSICSDDIVEYIIKKEGRQWQIYLK